MDTTLIPAVASLCAPVSKSTSQPPRTIVRLSVPVDVTTYARLCGLAALRGVDRSAIAANIIKAGLATVVVRAPGHAEEENTSN